ncbi:MAG: hypothetical protein K6F39_00820 [Lachnospiraceae bacterium]|nr:hypothetical protein [Lachnospiraceae bacterium]
MAFKTENELKNFDFNDSTLIEVQKGLSTWKLIISDVHILPDNSANRDIRTMRTNDLELSFTDGELKQVVEEGYTLLDVNERPYKEVPDKLVDEADYEEVFKKLQETRVDSVNSVEGGYKVVVRDEDHTWRMEFSGTGDVEKWERFMNL